MADDKQAGREGVNRRQFLFGGLGGAAMVGLGAVGGVAAGRASRPDGSRPLEPAHDRPLPAEDPIDEAAIGYGPDGAFETGLPVTRAIAFDTEGRVCVGGGPVVRRFDEGGKPIGELRCGADVAALRATDDGGILVATDSAVERYDAAGSRVSAGGLPITGGVITSMDESGDGDVYLADARHRVVLRCGADGKLITRIGDADETTRAPGFVVPSPYFDLLIATDGLLWVVNPGRHELEAYTADGDLESVWGFRSEKTPGFCGCCNPTAIAELPDGRFVTAEKGIRRVKVYWHDGSFDTVVAGPQHFGTPTVALGGGEPRKAVLDLAIDDRQRVLVLDAAAATVRRFRVKPTDDGAAAP